MTSRYLNQIQLKGVLKAGDAIAPGDGDLPALSQTDFILEVDRMLAYLNKDDLDGLRLVTWIFAYLPKFIIRLIINTAQKAARIPGVAGAPFRMLLIGIKGLVFTLYYSKINDNNGNGQKIFDGIKWDTKIVTSNTEEQAMHSEQSKNYKDPSEEDIQKIYQDASEAQPEIRNLSVKQRLLFIKELKKVILNRKEEIITRIQKETQKTRGDALVSEIFNVMDHFDYLEKKAHKVLKDQKKPTPIMLMGKKSRIYFEPLGTSLIISPWNYPFYQAITPITTSFITGNATIYKPSEYTPLEGLVEDLLSEAGFKQAWVQVVYGEGKTGSDLIAQRPDKIFFTGSVNTGKKIMAQASEHIIPVELELGGKDPMLVFEDANIQRSVAGCVWGALTCTGQACTSVEKVYVQESIYETFKEELLRQLNNVKQTIDTDGDGDCGAMTNKQQVEIVKKHIQDAEEKGAKILTGNEWDRSSDMIPPLVLENLTENMLIAKEETFGPIIPLYRFYDEGEAIELANDTDYGLSASVWSNDQTRCDRVARAIVTGNVSINNVMISEGNHHLPFGGTKMSGIGRYKGEFGLHSFSNIKSILIDKNSSSIEVNWYPYTREKYQLFSKLTDNAFSDGILSFIKVLFYGLRLETYSNNVGKKGRKN